MKLLLSAIILLTASLLCLCSLPAHISAQPPRTATPTPSATPPVYQPKTAPAPAGTPSIKPPVYTATGPRVAKLTKASLVGTWLGTVTQGVNKPVANGFRFALTGSELFGFWLNGSEEKPISSKDITLTDTMFAIKIADPDYTITFVGYIVEETGALKGTTMIETMGQKEMGIWAADRKPATSAPASPKDLVERGQQLMGQKDYEGALKLFNQAIVASPDYIDAYRFRGITALLIYEQNPRMEGQKLYTALFNFDHAIKRGSTNPDDYFLRGQTNEKLGHKEKAIVDYRNALKYHSRHENAREALSRLGEKP